MRQLLRRRRPWRRDVQGEAEGRDERPALLIAEAVGRSLLPLPFRDRRGVPPTDACENDGHREDVLAAAVEPLPGANLSEMRADVRGDAGSRARGVDNEDEDLTALSDQTT